MRKTEATVPVVESRDLRYLCWAVATLEALAHKRGVRIITGEVAEDLARLPEEVVGLASTKVDLGLLSPSAAKAASVAVKAKVLLAELRPKLRALLGELGDEGKEV